MNGELNYRVRCGNGLLSKTEILTALKNGKLYQDSDGPGYSVQVPASVIFSGNDLPSVFFAIVNKAGI